MKKVKNHSFKLDDNRRLLTEPENTVTPRIFVAATRQNEGKTTTCLGLFATLQSIFPKVGYIKPIGQRFIDIDGLKIDEDTFLLDSIYNVEIPMEAMSPVAIDATFTRRFIDGQVDNKLLVDKICRSFDRAAFGRDAVIIEGSGHAGVGAICSLSNAEVAKMLHSKAIIVSSGGIGRPVDEVALNKSLFDKHGVEVIGAILNKVQPDKIELVRNYAGKGLERLGVPLLGIIPVREQLTAPNLSQIIEETKGRWINGEANGSGERIHRIVVGAMAAKGIIDYFQPGVLVITPGDRDDVLLSAIASSGISGKKVVSGIILTRDILPHPKLMELLQHTQIPIAVCAEDSYAVASCIHSMTVKTQPQDIDKIPIIKELVMQNIDLKQIVSRITS
jgi:BioD-like phosphotransacetylase family protein